ncbi:MAG: S26 family signal peptidase [Burkholderiales bacterium]|nr:S26 family signal peptidase [Burkholderiales bacterium]
MTPASVPRVLPFGFDAEAFGRNLRAHLGRWVIAYFVLVLAAILFKMDFALGLNSSESLPDRVFLIHKGELPARGQYVAFRWSGGGPYPAGVTFVKILAGVPGDTVTRIERDFFVNGEFVGTAKTQSRSGVPLEGGPTGALPPGRYYVRAPHPDSLDSRYRLTGWVAESQMIGRAYALF